MAALPTTANGKLDVGALTARLPPPPDDPDEPDDPLVRELLALWRTVLGEPAVGPHSNFFLSGGHSVLAADLLVLVEERLGARVGFRELCAAPTPAGRAARLRRDDPVGAAR